MNRAERRQHLKALQGQIAQRMGANIAEPKPTKGFGLTITNKRVAVLFWTRAYFWSPQNTVKAIGRFFAVTFAKFSRAG